MKIGTLIMMIFFLIAILASIGGTAYYYTQTINSMEQEVYKHLESIAQSRASHIETLLEEEEEIARNLALIGKIERLLLRSKSDSDYNAQIKSVRERLQKTVDSSDQILSIGVIDENNIVISSTNSELIGWDYSKSIFFKENSKEETRIQFSKDPTLGITLNIVSPIYNSETKEYLGLIEVLVDSEEIDKIVLDKTGIGETGETYMINNAGYLLTPPLFGEGSILEFKIDSLNSRECFLPSEKSKIHTGHEAVKIFLDYRGEKVVGTHRYLPEVGWCLLAEIDEEEILSEQRELFQRITLMIIVSITVIVTIIGFFIGRYLDKIVVLKKGKKKL